MYARKCYSRLNSFQGSGRCRASLAEPSRSARSLRGLTLGGRGLGDVTSIQEQIAAMANQYGIPPSIALAVAQIESSFNPAAIGPVTSSGQSATGLFQLMPGTASDMGVNPSDPSQNIQGGVNYLAQLYAQFGNWTQALEAYNAGPNGNLNAVSGYASSVLAAQPAYTSFDSSSVSDSSGVDLSSVSSLLPDLSDSSGMLPWVLVGLAAAGLIYAVSP